MIKMSKVEKTISCGKAISVFSIMKKVVILYAFLLCNLNVFGQSLKYSGEIVIETLNNVKAFCDNDNGRLWGKNLWGPILVIDRKTRFIIANQQDSAGVLIPIGDIFCGTYPKDMIIANSTTKLWGTYWTMVASLPADDYKRNTLFVHESFHRLQTDIGLRNLGYENNHMDDMLARVLLKLEWSALEAAISISDSNNYNRLIDALIFRFYRRSHYPNSHSMESRFEIHEGLPEYTAHKLCSSSEQELKENLLSKHDDYWVKESFVRSFGYYSGFLYAFVLDLEKISWRESITSSSDLGIILKDSLRLILPLDLKRAFDSIKDNYAYKSISNFEWELSNIKDSINKKNYNTFFSKPVLKIELSDPHIGFNVNSMQPLDTLGIVYEYIVITDNWGRLEVEREGCLLNPDWSWAIIPSSHISISNNIIHGLSWELTLNNGWELVQSESNYYIRLKEPLKN
jgi:hypothetical protein